MISKGNPEKELFPLKMRDAAQAAGFAYIQSKGLIPEDDSDDYIPVSDTHCRETAHHTAGRKPPSPQPAPCTLLLRKRSPVCPAALLRLRVVWPLLSVLGLLQNAWHYERVVCLPPALFYSSASTPTAVPCNSQV